MNQTKNDSARHLVLVADDDAASRLIACEVLQQSGFDVVEASDGKEALQCYENSAPDIILLDVEMPHLDGFSVCKMIRDKETSRKTPICIVTGLDDEESVDRAYNLGATDFISKPIAWPVLGHRVRYILRANEALNEIKGLVLALPDTVFILDEQGRTHDLSTELNERVCRSRRSFRRKTGARCESVSGARLKVANRRFMSTIIHPAMYTSKRDSSLVTNTRCSQLCETSPSAKRPTFRSMIWPSTTS
jgi:DNA-binding response OmpR family regulator